MSFWNKIFWILGEVGCGFDNEGILRYVIFKVM